MYLKKKNIDAMVNSDCFLYNSLKDNKAFLEWNSCTKKYKCDNLYTEEARDCNLVTYVCMDDCTYRLNSKYYPEEEAAIWAKPYQPNEFGRTNRIFYIFGFGNGYFIKELIKVIDEDEIVLIYEPSKEMFFHALENYDLQETLKNTKILVYVNGLSRGEWQDVLSDFNSSIIYGNNVYISLPQYDKIFSKEREQFNKSYTEYVFDAIMDRNTMKRFGGDWAVACIDNAKTAFRSRFIGDYRNVLQEGIPVIVVAAGPSLQKNVHMLKKAKGKALILAVDTALNYLEQNNVVPDFIVTIDVHKPMDLFDNRIGKQQPMFAGATANPSVIKYNEGEKIFFDVFKFLSKIKQIPNDYTPIQISGCVANMAFEIGRYIGAKTIILVGQDLAFAGENTHAGGRNDGALESRFALVEGNYGEKLWTRQDWYSYLIWYNREIALFDGVVINATEGGAKIDGTIIMGLEDAIAKYCKERFDSETFFKWGLNHQLDDLDTEKWFNKIIDELLKANTLAQEAVELCEYLVKENQTAKEESYVSMNKTKRLSEINKEIGSLDISEVIDTFIYDVTISEYEMIFNRFKEKSENRLNVYMRALKIYQSIDKATKELLRKLESKKY